MSEESMSQDAATEADLLRQEIDQTRAELAETVDALSDKLNVKKQASQKVDQVRSTVSDRVDDARSTASEHPRELAIGGAVAAALVLLVVVIRRRRA